MFFFSVKELIQKLKEHKAEEQQSDLAGTWCYLLNKYCYTHTVKLGVDTNTWTY